MDVRRSRCFGRRWRVVARSLAPGGPDRVVSLWGGWQSGGVGGEGRVSFLVGIFGIHHRISWNQASEPTKLCAFLFFFCKGKEFFAFAQFVGFFEVQQLKAKTGGGGWGGGRGGLNLFLFGTPKSGFGGSVFLQNRHTLIETKGTAPYFGSPMLVFPLVLQEARATLPWHLNGS